MAMSGPLLVAILLIAAVLLGCMGVIQTGVNKVLTEKVGNVFISATTSFFFGALSLLLLNGVIFFTRVLPKQEKVLSTNSPSSRLSFWEIIGGSFGCANLVMRIFFSPIIGFTLFNVMAVSGQLTNSLFLDHIGFLGLAQRKASKVRLCAMAVVLAGCFVSNLDALTNNTAVKERGLLQFAVFCLGAFLSGVGLPMQAAANRRISERFNSRLRLMAAFFSFFSGLAVIIPLTVIFQLTKVLPSPPPFSEIMSQLRVIDLSGGILGAIFVSSAVFITSVLGVSIFFVCTIAGSIIGSMVIDEIGAFGTVASHTTLPRALGAVITFAGAAAVVNAHYIQRWMDQLRGKLASRFTKMDDSEIELGEIDEN